MSLQIIVKSLRILYNVGYSLGHFTFPLCCMFAVNHLLFYYPSALISSVDYALAIFYQISIFVLNNFFSLFRRYVYFQFSELHDSIYFIYF